MTTTTVNQNLNIMTRFGTVVAKSANSRRKKERQMKWLKNLFKSKKKKEAEAQARLAELAERKRILDEHLANLAKLEKKPKPTPKTTTATKKPVAKKPTTKKD